MSAALCLLSASACIEFNINPVERPPNATRKIPVTETFFQTPLPKVDLLLVIDRTASMDQELGALVDAADLLGQQLDDAGIGWQMGVVASEMAHSTAGWLLGDPWVLTPLDSAPGDHLAALLAVAPAGPPEEAGIAAALEALDLASAGGVNSGFRRFDAALHVIFISDGDDESDGWLAGDPVAAMVERLASEGTEAAPAQASAVVGDVPGGCTSAFGSAQPGRRYVEVAEATGGQVASICSTDFTAIVEALGYASIVLERVFPLRDAPVGDALLVSVDGVRTDGWTLDSELPAVVFDVAPPAGAEIAVSYTIAVEG